MCGLKVAEGAHVSMFRFGQPLLFLSETLCTDHMKMACALTSNLFWCFSPILGLSAFHDVGLAMPC